MNRPLVKSATISAITVLVLSGQAAAQQGILDLLQQSLQNELRVNTVEVQLRAEVKRPRYTPEQMRRWGFSEELIGEAKGEISSQVETEVIRLRMRFDNRNKMFECVEEREEAAAGDWKVLQRRSLTNDKAIVNYLEAQSERGDLRRELDRSAPKWPPLVWESEIWRYRTWHSCLPSSINSSAVKIVPVRGKPGEYAINFANVSILALRSQEGILLTRYTALDKETGYPEYEAFITYRQTKAGLPYPVRVKVLRFLVPPKGHLRNLRIPYRTPVEMTTYTVEDVRLNPAFDKQVFEEGNVPRGTFVQDNRFEPPLTYTQGGRQFDERDLFRMAQNRDLLQDADWMGYRPKPSLSTYIYFGVGLVLVGIALWFLSRIIGRGTVK